MKIDREEARRIAALAHLEFDDAGLDRMAAEMTAILGYIEILSEVKDPPRTGGEDPSLRSGVETLLRDDDVLTGVARDEVERNAPAWRDGHFVVPKVIGE